MSGGINLRYQHSRMLKLTGVVLLVPHTADHHARKAWEELTNYYIDINS